jgi:chromosome condensin MukBEF complex kleisin-like MukF subunit
MVPLSHRLSFPGMNPLAAAAVAALAVASHKMSFTFVLARFNGKRIKVSMTRGRAMPKFLFYLQHFNMKTETIKIKIERRNFHKKKSERERIAFRQK